MRTDGFRNRYIVKVGSSIIIAVLNIVIQLILPRAFSVEEFGYYSYNLNVLTSVVTMINLSTSDAMVSKFSKRNEEIGIVLFYLKYFAMAALLLCVGITVLFPTGFIQNTFAGQSFVIVILGLLTAIVARILTDTICIYDAFAVSRYPAVMQVLLKVSVSLFVLITYIAGHLNLLLFYIMQVCMTGVIVLILLLAIIKEQRKRYPTIINKGFRQYAKEYFIYCRPLASALAISQIMVIIMNWALMKWFGVTEQAIFGAAWQLNTLVGYVFSPYAELSKREFAVLYADKKQLNVRLDQALRLMFWITSYFSIFIGIGADWILPVIYGDKYTGAHLVTLLIMYYTIYQAWGQITGSLMLGLELTRLNAIFTVAGQMMTLAAVFIFQIPNFIWPQGLGATGIALNYLTVCFFITQTRIIVLGKKLGMKVIRELTIQILPLVLCTVLSMGLKCALNGVIQTESIGSNFLKIGISGVVYTVVIVGIVWRYPSLVGLSRESILSLMRRRKH